MLFHHFPRVRITVDYLYWAPKVMIWWAFWFIIVVALPQRARPGLGELRIRIRIRLTLLR